MSKGDLVLALLASAAGRAYSPAQLQKTAFLVTRNLPHIMDSGDTFDFQPYDYGPFDKSVYLQADVLKALGQAEIAPSGSGRWVTYAATEQGLAKGQELLGRLPEDAREYVHNVSRWALSQSFTTLVKSIYEQYPEMRQNSIFRG